MQGEQNRSSASVKQTRTRWESKVDRDTKKVGRDAKKVGRDAKKVDVVETRAKARRIDSLF